MPCVADFVSNFFNVFHLFQFPQHGIVFNQFGSVQQASCAGSFFPAHDAVGLRIFFCYQHFVHNVFYIAWQNDVADTETIYGHTQIFSSVFYRLKDEWNNGIFFSSNSSKPNPPMYSRNTN